MNLPTTEDLDREEALYREHLENGGKPIQLILTLVPGVDRKSFDWHSHSEVPGNLPDLPLLKMFAGIIKEAVNKAIQPGAL